MKKLSLLFLLLSSGLQAQTTARGIVYEDKNQNGQQDARERGIPEVAVTNGVEVVLTDRKGRYRLPVSEDAIISVIKPSGYSVPTNEYNAPQFFYIHKPEGSPKLEFEAVAPTGDLPESVDFGLIPGEEQETFSMLVFSDPQVYTLEEVDFFRRGIVAEVEGIQGIPFGITLGDLVGNTGLYGEYANAVKEVGIPWYNVLGNHDLNFDAKSPAAADETFEAHFGPTTYAFNHGKVHFIVLDNVLYPDPRDQRGNWAGFWEEQLEFVKNDLQHVPKDHLVVLAFHIPLEEPEGGETFRDEDREKLFDLLKDHPHTLSLSAHTHAQRQIFHGREDAWHQENPHHEFNLGTTSGDWYSGKLNEQGIPISTMRDGTPKGYAFVHFDGNQYKIDYKVAGKPSDYQIRIFAPKVVAKAKKGTKAGIYANFFMGTEKDSVMYRIDGGDWMKMRHVEEFDPSFVAQIYERDLSEELLSGRRASNPIPSSHLWRGYIPNNLEPGEHSIEVKAKDMYGREFRQSGSYRIELPPEGTSEGP